MDICDLILESEDPTNLLSIYGNSLIQEKNLLQKRIIGMYMTMQIMEENIYQSEIDSLEERISKINTCIALSKKHKAK